jgi:hypothetical protein
MTSGIWNNISQIPVLPSINFVEVKISIRGYFFITILLFAASSCSEKDPVVDGQMEANQDDLNDSSEGITMHQKISFQELNKSFYATDKRRVTATPLLPYPPPSHQDLQND